MTSKQRVERSFGHHEPDRAPTGELVAMPGSFCSELLGRDSFKGFLSERANAEALWDGRRDELVESRIRDTMDIARQFEHDIVSVELLPGSNSPLPERLMPHDNGTWKNRRGDIFMLSEDRYVCTEPGNPDASAPLLADPSLADYKPDDSELQMIREVKRELGNDRYLVMPITAGPPGITYPRLWGRNEDWIYIFEYPDEWTARTLEETELIFSASVRIAREAGLDGITYNHDLGHHGAPFLPPDTFERTVAKVLARRTEILHAAGFKHILHSCGNNRVVMDMIVDAGVDVYQSIQPEMPIAELKKSFGNRLVLWGGVTAELLLENADEHELRENCRQALHDCSYDGGYVYGTSHSVMPGARPEKYRIMMQELTAGSH